MKITCKPNYRPYIIHTPIRTHMGEVEIGKNVMAIEPSLEAEFKDKNGNITHTSGSCPQVFFEDKNAFFLL